MIKYKMRKRNFYLLLVVLFVVSVGIGYSALTQQLKIDNTVSYDAMKWDVGFSSVTPVQWVEGSVLPSVTVSEDKKTIYIDCDFGSSTSSKECTTVAGISNLSTFNVELLNEPKAIYDSSLIKNIEINWIYDQEDTDGDITKVEELVTSGLVLGQNITKELVIRIISNDLTADMLPSTVLTIPISITFDWVESDKVVD